MRKETEHVGLNPAALAPDKQLHPLEARERLAFASKVWPLAEGHSKPSAARRGASWLEDARTTVWAAMDLHAWCKTIFCVDPVAAHDPGLRTKSDNFESLKAGAGWYEDKPQPAEHWARALDTVTGVAVDWGDIYTVNHALQLAARAPRDVPDALRRRLQQRVTTERCYYSIKHEDLDTAEEHLVAFSREVLRFPYRFMDYSQHTSVRETGDVGCGLLWHIAAGTAMAEERWRKATNIYGYLRRAARGIINHRILEEGGDRIAAVNAGFSWREPIAGNNTKLNAKQWNSRMTRNPPRAMESTYDPIGILDPARLHEVLDAAKFTPDMRAYLGARIANIKLGDMPEYLTSETDRWTRRRIDAAREDVKRAAGAALAAWHEIANTEPGVTCGTAAGLVPITVGGWDSGARYDAAPPAPKAVKSEGGASCYSMGSVTHYRQPLWVGSPGNGFPWVFAHKYDTGDGVMDRESMSALREVIAEERRALFSGSKP